MQTRHRRQGRTRAGELILRRAHARRLLLTLADICQRLRAQLATPAARAEYRAVERRLLQLARKKKA